MSASGSAPDLHGLPTRPPDRGAPRGPTGPSPFGPGQGQGPGPGQPGMYVPQPQLAPYYPPGGPAPAPAGNKTLIIVAAVAVVIAIAAVAVLLLR